MAAASRSRSGSAWLYTRSVTLASAWPNRPASVRTSWPLAMSWVALKCRGAYRWVSRPAALAARIVSLVTTSGRIGSEPAGEREKTNAFRRERELELARQLLNGRTVPVQDAHAQLVQCHPPDLVGLGGLLPPAATFGLVDRAGR